MVSHASSHVERRRAGREEGLDRPPAKVSHFRMGPATILLSLAAPVALVVALTYMGVPLGVASLWLLLVVCPVMHFLLHRRG